MTRGVQSEAKKYGGTHINSYGLEPKIEVQQNGLKSREYPTDVEMNDPRYSGHSHGAVNNNQNGGYTSNTYQNENTQYGQPYYGPQNQDAYAGKTGYSTISTARENTPYIAGYSDNQQNGREPSAMGYKGSIHTSNDQWHDDFNAEKTGILVSL